MSLSMTVQRSYTLGGKQFAEQQTLAAANQVLKEDAIAPAKGGVLTTHTSTSAGTLTMNAGHGFTTGCRLDLYWVGGSRRGVVAGTVATNSVPISGGAGTDLPAASTAITAMVPIEHDVVAIGNNVVGMVFYSDKAGMVTFTDGSDTEQACVQLANAGTFEWDDLQVGAANPLAGVTTGKAYFSHGSDTVTATMRFGFLLN